MVNGNMHAAGGKCKKAKKLNIFGRLGRARRAERYDTNLCTTVRPRAGKVRNQKAKVKTGGTPFVFTFAFRFLTFVF